ncbi:UNVERIFIED_CONTAM: hypothetical protein FKN15_039869 [Acipenser sinensis]
MVEMAGWQTALQAEGQYIIIIKGEEEMAGTSSPAGMGEAQVHIKQEATSPPDTRLARQEVNKGAYYHQLQYDGKADWQDFLKQFKIMAMIKGWADKEKASSLVACLNQEALLSLCLMGERRVKPRHGPNANRRRERGNGNNMMPGASRQAVKAGRYDGKSPMEGLPY